MYCLTCQYPLKELLDCRCPECGREFDPERSETYTLSRRQKLVHIEWPTAIAIAYVCVGILGLGFVWSVMLVMNSQRIDEVTNHILPTVVFLSILVVIVGCVFGAMAVERIDEEDAHLRKVAGASILLNICLPIVYFIAFAVLEYTGVIP